MLKWLRAAIKVAPIQGDRVLRRESVNHYTKAAASILSLNQLSEFLYALQNFTTLSVSNERKGIFNGT